MFMDITKKIEEILLNDGLQYQSDEELRTETEFLKNKKKEESETFKIKELNL